MLDMTRIEFRIRAQLKDSLKETAAREGMSLSEYLVDLIQRDRTERRRFDAKLNGLSFSDACSIFEEFCEANNYIYSQPSESDSSYHNGVWTLNNIHGLLAKVGTACCCVILPDSP